MTAGRRGRGEPPLSLEGLLRDAFCLGVSTFAVAAVLYLLVPEARPPAGHAIATGGALLVWCYCDGTIGRLNLGLAAVEALLRLRLVVAWVELLFDALRPEAG